MEISTLIGCLNEEKQLPKLFAPLKDVKDIVFVDHGSTDNSVKIAKKFGARVYKREFIHDVVTEEDVKDFTNRFGYAPKFKVGDKMYNAKRERTEMQKLCKNDWILALDCDEVITWKYKEVLKILDNCDTVNCKYFHERNADGSRTPNWVQTTKLFNRTKTFWIGRIHEVLNGYNLRIGFSNDMDIDHYSRFREYKKTYANILEYAVLRDQDLRCFYYLGVEYHFWGEWEKAINIFTIYLKEAFYEEEKILAYIKIADSLWNLGREDEAFIYALQAFKIDPESNNVWNFLLKISPRRNVVKLEKFARLAVNKHLMM